MSVEERLRAVRMRLKSGLQSCFMSSFANGRSHRAGISYGPVRKVHTDLTPSRSVSVANGVRCHPIPGSGSGIHQDTGLKDRRIHRSLSNWLSTHAGLSPLILVVPHDSAQLSQADQ